MGYKRLSASLALGLTACSSPRLPQFERILASQPSATAALGQWCAARRIADPATIAARPVRGEDAAEPGDLHQLLALPADRPAGYRHVRLSCGGAVLSQAHNWFVPERLTPRMNAALASTDTPFGTIAAPLRFTRERLESRRGRASICPRGTALSHRALLRLPDGQPLALVVECYTSANLRRGH